jgi:Tetracyclin repressor, C-terminal all-alpha domain.
LLLAQAEWILAALDGLGLDANTMLHIQLTLSNYVRGTAVNLEQEVQFERDTGLTEEQWMASAEADAAVTMVLESNLLPRFSNLFASQELSLNLDTLFEFGLGRVLDGIGALIEQGRG